MSLSATLFYTFKTYPRQVITGKSTIPEDPQELLKDRVFMSVVFTAKHYSKYPKYVLPGTRLKEDMHCTEAILDQIFDSLSRKYHLNFRKRKFKDIEELTIYVKDHMSSETDE